MSSPAVSKYIPPSKRAGFDRAAKRETVADFTSPQDKAGDQLKALGFVKGASGNYYFPEDHPHVHIGLGVAKAFMAYSEGEQHKGGRGIQMYQNGRLTDYQLGIEKMKSEYPDKKITDVINQAAVILNAYCAASGGHGSLGHEATHVVQQGAGNAVRGKLVVEK
jgi:hypothetical protein